MPTPSDYVLDKSGTQSVASALSGVPVALLERPALNLDCPCDAPGIGDIVTAFDTVFDSTATDDITSRTNAQNLGGQVKSGMEAVDIWDTQESGRR